MSGDVRLVSQRAAESVYVEVDDFRRRAGRGDESAGGAVPLAVVAEFLQRRNILEGRITLRIEDAPRMRKTGLRPVDSFSTSPIFAQENCTSP